ncbi:MAG: SRPBCC family protein [Chloroflexota bacterium]|nr:SRPBCC family protein [Chloroflexota bacterium]
MKEVTRRNCAALWLLSSLTGGSLGLYALIVSGALTVDLGLGRRTRPLGPITVVIDASRELVFEIISAPYLGRTPRGLEEKLRVIERAQDMVLAAHYTRVHGLVVATLETVRFSAPDRIDFRLVRGPVPYVVEHFLLRDRNGRCELEYGGELGTDLWGVGEAWGKRVARVWEEAVHTSLDRVRAEAERRASNQHRHDAG